MKLSLASLTLPAAWSLVARFKGTSRGDDAGSLSLTCPRLELRIEPTNPRPAGPFRCCEASSDGRRPQPEIPKAYDPSTTEGPLYQFWLDGGYFTPRMDPEKQPFCIIMPPPNVTGELHLGHALTATMEDALIRWHRMRGDPTLWLPGVDHAGIATQNVVERELAKEGLSRHDLGREKFVERVWEWVHKYRGVIASQHMRLGASCDWGREVFTMDGGPQRGGPHHLRTTCTRTA